ncbi:MAG TPA: hypothetical protein VMW27_17555 [Thermoanaerobaculia bacterium]|nr:hypothetical protein [Thermoanaerobaculia bacterium]
MRLQEGTRILLILGGEQAQIGLKEPAAGLQAPRLEADQQRGGLRILDAGLPGFLS